MNLVIVESPSKAKTIEKYLGKDYKVLSSVGHIRDLPKSEKEAINIAEGYKPKYVISEDKKKIIDELKKHIKKTDGVLLATDPDREGEAIAWHLQEVLQVPDAKRVVFYEITEDAVKEALKSPRKIDKELLAAQEARRVLDRLFGYGLSGLIWKKLRYGLSAGRVQSPALRILVEREKEIKAFEPVPYWILNANLKHNKDEFTAKYEKTIYDKKELKALESFFDDRDWHIVDVLKKQKKRNPYAPFITSTLQQAANTYFGYSPSQTMRIAQKLYEAGHITYMRTDSTRLSKDAHNQIGKYVIKKYGKENYNSVEYVTKKKTAQEAHEAIRPTNVLKETVSSGQEANIYKLIHSRVIASQMKPATIESTTLLCTVSATSKSIKKEFKPDNFKVSGSIVIEKGWMMADSFSESKEKNLPNLKKGDKLVCKGLETEDKETTPPPRYSEAGLVKEMEERGIGRPSTYANTIRVLIERKYVEKENRTLIPTETGMVVTDFLEGNFHKYITDKFTAHLEDDLDEIAEGEKKYVEVLDSFYQQFKKDVDSKADIEKITVIGDVDDEFRCPICGAKMVYRLSRNGKFMSCSKFPECQGARKEDGSEVKPPEKIGKKCPKCSGELVLKEGKYGKFIACDNYPKCKYIEEDEGERQKAMTDVKCPVCKKGYMKKRMGRFGEFYSCERYPDCKNAINAKPTGNLCEKCGALMMEGTKTIPERCSVKTCPNNRPDRKN